MFSLREMWEKHAKLKLSQTIQKLYFLRIGLLFGDYDHADIRMSDLGYSYTDFMIYFIRNVFPKFVFWRFKIFWSQFVNYKIYWTFLNFYRNNSTWSHSSIGEIIWKYKGYRGQIRQILWCSCEKCSRKVCYICCLSKT